MADSETPGPLDALRGEGETVSKLDLLLGYVRGVVTQNKVILQRLGDGDRRFDDHEREIKDLQRRLGRKSKPEPSWWVRAAVIAAITTGTNLMLIFVLKGGLAKLVAAAAASGAGP
jgi:hypothetical protein